MSSIRVAATAALALGCLVVGQPAPAEVVKQAQRCALAKLRAARSAAATVFACSAAEARGKGPAGPCIADAQARLLTAFAKADRRPLCATRDDGEVIRTTIQEYHTRIAGILVQPNPAGKPCEAARFDAVATATANQIACFLVAARRDVVFDFDCLVAERLQLIDVFATLASGGACFGGGASEVLGELNFLVGTIGARIQWTVCGNGVIELGENCDGGSLCDPACRFALPSCCRTLAGCFDATVGSCPPELGEQVAGAVCEPSGQCVPQAIAPTALCCQEEQRACSETVATDTAAIVAAIGGCTEPFGGRPIRIGACNRRGQCSTVAP